ncbi:TonB-dependent receptor plug domain-containing protein [Sphingomonas japonica]|uniref:Vitamin B12 transporter n=1 Tax=Sphingomonas japonica TaxID=511662 RepID=A0ABX0TZ10_9SPHN|nr:TonB-dependent receptor [Sphingomonas japonica]NIJ22564.1 vitamin B12 transporter [Sphingomonas japonica]
MASLTLLTLTTPATAQDRSQSEITVTATRTPQPIDEVGQPVTVLDRDLIEQRQTVAVSDLIATTPGVTINRNGSIGSTTGIFVRGAETDQTLVLIDGVRVNDPASPGGAFNFGDLLTGNIDRIEVLRGSNSVAWGSQAVGGVVNIVSAAPTDTPTLNAAAEYGSFDTVNARANASARVGPAALSIGGSYFESDGISQAAIGTEADGYQNTTLNARADIALTDTISADLRGYYILGNLDVDGYLPDFSFGDTDETSRTEQWIGYAGLNYASSDARWAGRVAYSYFENDRRNRSPDAVTYDGYGRTERFEAQAGLQPIEPLKLVLGYEHEAPNYLATSFGTTTSGRVNIDSAFALAILSPIEPLTLTAGVRHDDHSRFGGATTFGASGAYAVGDFAIVRAAYGEGFKAPTLYQLLGDYGNPDLVPETSKSYEAGVTLFALDRAIALGGTWYTRDTQNLIGFVDCDTTIPVCAGGERPFGVYSNTRLTRAEGVEATLDLRPSNRLTLAANYTLTQSRDRTPGPTFDKRLIRRPVDVANFSIDWQSPFAVALGSTIRMVGDSFENGGNTLSTDGYAVVDIRAGIDLGDRLELYGRVENLFDAEYQTVRDYGTYPLSAYGGVRVRL